MEVCIMIVYQSISIVGLKKKMIFFLICRVFKIVELFFTDREFLSLEKGRKKVAMQRREVQRHSEMP